MVMTKITFYALCAILLSLPVYGQTDWGGPRASGSGNTSGGFSVGEKAIKLVNGTSLPLTSVYISSAGSAAWIEDKLGSQVISPGKSVNVPVDRDNCRYDIRAVFSDGSEKIVKGFDVCRSGEIEIK